MSRTAGTERGKHRRDEPAVEITTSMTREDMGILAKAVALQESGILVHALTVTDLSSGFSVTGTGALPEDPFKAGEDEPRFRGSALGLRNLEVLRELVADVIEQRRAHPEWAHIDPPGGRTTFPWGVGMKEPDVLVAGMHAGTIAEYLRCVGMRARTVDVDQSLRIHADLRDVQQELDLAPGDGGTGDFSANKRTFGGGERGIAMAMDARESTEPKYVVSFPGDGDSEELDGFEDEEASRTVEAREWRAGRAGSLLDSRALRIAVMATVAIVSVAGIGALLTLAPSGKTGGSDATMADSVAVEENPSTVPETSTSQAPATTTATPSESAEKPWSEHRVAGEQVVTASAERAEIPVMMDAPGWNRAGATAKREEFMSADEGMRVLVSATATPVESQEKLDEAVLRALEGMAEIRVANRAPVSYEEVYPDSTTLWHVRLVDGYQVSIGCQFREVTGERLRACDTAAQSARVDLPRLNANHE